MLPYITLAAVSDAVSLKASRWLCVPIHRGCRLSFSIAYRPSIPQSESQDWIRSDNCTRCPSEIEVGDQSQSLLTPRSSTDAMASGAWQGCDYSTNCPVTGKTQPRKAGFDPWITHALGGHQTTMPSGRPFIDTRKIVAPYTNRT